MEKISNINYWEIFKKAARNTWKNPRLLWFGLFIAITSGTNFNSSYSAEENDPSWERVQMFWVENSEWIIPLIIVCFIIFLALSVLAIFSRAGLLLSLEKIHKNKEGLTFKEGIREGKRYFWKLLFLGILLSLIFLMVLFIISIPIIFLFSGKHFILAGLLTFFGVIIIIPLGALFFFLGNYGQIYIVLGKMKTWTAIESAYSLFVKNILSSVVMALLFIPVKIATFISIFILLIAVGIVFAIFTGLLFLASKIAGLIIGIVLGALVILALLLLISSAFQVFRQSAWLLFFEKIARQKQEEKIAEPVEETETAKPAPAPDGA